MRATIKLGRGWEWKLKALYRERKQRQPETVAELLADRDAPRPATQPEQVRRAPRRKGGAAENRGK
jgi:hypothetical protein